MNSDDTDKAIEESRETSPSQLKRRRMLQFPSDSSEPASVNGQKSSYYISKVNLKIAVISLNKHAGNLNSGVFFSLFLIYF